MRQAAYILSIIGTVMISFTLIPLIWCIPMTIAVKKSIGDGRPHVALGVCTMLFTPWLFGIPAGILILIPENSSSN